MKRLKELVIQIETNRQRLQFAVAEQDIDLMYRMQRLLTLQQTEFYELTRDAVLSSKVNVPALSGARPDDSVWVISEKVPFGEVILDQASYRVLVSLMNHEERETHMATPVAKEMVAYLSGMIMDRWQRGA